MHLSINNKFTKILGQFKPKKEEDLFVTCNFKLVFKPLKFKICKFKLFIE